MSEFFLELFSEEIPANLQSNARNVFLQNFKDFFIKKNINFKRNFSFSTPNRLIIFFDGVDKEVIKQEEEIRGPNTNAPGQALQGFLKSFKITEDKIFKKQMEKGEFYFYKKPEEKINTKELLEQNIPEILDKISWKKSMKWSNFDLTWARPLKSILAIFDKKTLVFDYYHLRSTNFTYIDKEYEEKTKIFKDFKSFNEYFKKMGTIIDHDLRKQYVKKELEKIAKRKNLLIEIDNRLLDEVTNLVDQPNILHCKFDPKFLDMPEEILIITMKNHQKYFNTFDSKKNITNDFLVVANNKDSKGFIKSGNERVVEARLNDAQFFWKKNKSQNMVKQISKLKSMNYFKGLGSYFDKIQRMRKLNGIVSDELFISKEKAELSSSISKVDLVSDLVGEFPELQGIMGGYFAEEQGFDKDICLAIKEHYLPIGISGKLPKKPFSLALALTDKLDTLVGFFGIDNKPTSSKDPYALRRLALGLIRLIVENKKEFKVRDLINYSTLLYQEQSFKFINKDLQKELTEFLSDRFKYYMKEKEIRPDIIEASLDSFDIDHIAKAYEKSTILNKFINKEIGSDIISSYKRASNILEHELKNNGVEISNSADPGLFRSEYEKNLYKKIQDLKKYFSNASEEENYKVTLENLAESKKVIYEFFDNVKVNDEDKNIQKNRLELLQMLCKTFDNYITFSNIESTL